MDLAFNLTGGPASNSARKVEAEAADRLQRSKKDTIALNGDIMRGDIVVGRKEGTSLVYDAGFESIDNLADDDSADSVISPGRSMTLSSFMAGRGKDRENREREAQARLDANKEAAAAAALKRQEEREEKQRLDRQRDQEREDRADQRSYANQAHLVAAATAAAQAMIVAWKAPPPENKVNRFVVVCAGKPGTLECEAGCLRFTEAPTGASNICDGCGHHKCRHSV